MPSRSFEVPDDQVQTALQWIARRSLNPGDVIFSGIEYQADLGPTVRIIEVSGLPAQGRYAFTASWLDDFKGDLLAGLFDPD